MECEGRQDDFYRGDDFCPIPAVVYRVIASMHLVLISCVIGASALQIKRRFLTGRTRTPWFIACAAFFIGSILGLPLNAGRAWHGSHDHSVLALVCGSISHLLMIMGHTHICLTGILRAMTFAFALRPQKIKSWSRIIKKLQVVYHCCNTLFILGRIPLFIAGSEWHQPCLLLQLFCWNFEVFIDFALVCVLLREITKLQRSLPKEVPMKIRRGLKNLKSGFVCGVILSFLVLLFQLIAFVSFWPDFWKLGGFLILYVFIPILTFFCLFVTLPKKIVFKNKGKNHKRCSTRSSIGSESITALIEQGVQKRLISRPSLNSQREHAKKVADVSLDETPVNHRYASGGSSSTPVNHPLEGLALRRSTEFMDPPDDFDDSQHHGNCESELPLCLDLEGEKDPGHASGEVVLDVKPEAEFGLPGIVEIIEDSACSLRDQPPLPQSDGLLSTASAMFHFSSENSSEASVALCGSRVPSEAPSEPVYSSGGSSSSCSTKGITQLDAQGPLTHGVTFTTSPPVWVRGVSMDFLERYVREYDLKGLSTEEVCNKYVKPATKRGRCSVWEAVWLADPESDLLGKPTVFVSHAWQYDFLVLMSILRLYCDSVKSQSKRGASTTTYFFLDVFIMNQHDLSEISIEGEQDGNQMTCKEKKVMYDVMLHNLEESIGRSGKVLLALDPWHKPIPLTRCWCLYEAYIARKTGCSLTMCFSEKAEEEFLSDLEGNQNALEDLFRRVDVRNAEATAESDLTMILRCIDESVGTDEFNAFLQDELQSALKMIAMQCWMNKMQ